MYFCVNFLLTMQKNRSCINTWARSGVGMKYTPFSVLSVFVLFLNIVVYRKIVVGHHLLRTASGYGRRYRINCRLYYTRNSNSSKNRLYSRTNSIGLGFVFNNSDISIYIYIVQ